MRTLFSWRSSTSLIRKSINNSLKDCKDWNPNLKIKTYFPSFACSAKLLITSALTPTKFMHCMNTLPSPWRKKLAPARNRINSSTSANFGVSFSPAPTRWVSSSLHFHCTPRTYLLFLMESWRWSTTKWLTKTTGAISRMDSTTLLRKFEISRRTTMKIHYESSQYLVWGWPYSTRLCFCQSTTATTTNHSSFRRIGWRSIWKSWWTAKICRSASTKPRKEADIANSLLKCWPWYLSPIPTKEHPSWKFMACSLKSGIQKQKKTMGKAEKAAIPTKTNWTKSNLMSQPSPH